MPRIHQCQAVLEWLRSGWQLTQEIASKEMGIRRLASRIDNLRSRGYEIKTTMIKVPSRWNEPGGTAVTKVAEYKLVKDIPGPSYWERPRMKRGRKPLHPQPTAPAPVQAPIPAFPPSCPVAPDRAGQPDAGEQLGFPGIM